MLNPFLRKMRNHYQNRFAGFTERPWTVGCLTTDGSFWLVVTFLCSKYAKTINVHIKAVQDIVMTQLPLLYSSS
jgi:hypothetical protein